MPEYRFERVHDRVWRLPTPYEGGMDVNLYIVRGTQTCLVDSGVLGTPTTYLAPALAELGLALGDVDLVVNTHGHMDHLGGNAEVKDSGAEIGIHREDAPRAQSNQVHIDRVGEGMRALGIEGDIAKREAYLMRMLGRAVGVDRMLEDGDIVDLGADVRLTVVHTPGHTPGAVCYWWEAAGLLLTGDSLLGRGARADGLPVVERAASYRPTLRKARDIGAPTLLMGHAFRSLAGPAGPVATGAAVDDFLDTCETLDRLLLDAAETVLAQAHDATLGDQSRRMVDLLRDRFTLADNSAGDFPFGATATLPSYLTLAKEAAAGT